jgi:O-antigen/teichoic acid export membrane protein
MDQDFEKKIIRNTLFNVYGRIFTLAVGFLLTPYIIGKIGNSEYGIWILIGAFVAYLGLLDFGFGTSFVKYIAEYDTKGDREGVNAILSTGLIVYVIFGAVIIAGTYPMIEVILNLLTIPEEMREKAVFVLKMAIITSVSAGLIGVYHSLIGGFQKMDLLNGIIVIMAVCYAVGSVIVLELGLGIEGLAVNQLVTQVIGTVVTIYIAYRIYPGLKFNLRAVKKHFFMLLRYGANLQISMAAVLVNFHLDKLLVNRFIDASHVTFYDIGSRLPVAARTVPTMLLSALVPASSELEVREGKTAIYQLFCRASKYVALVALPLFAGAIATGRSFIAAWMGQGFDPSVVVMSILCIGYSANIVAGSVSPIVMGMGRPEYLRNTETISLFLNVLLSVVLIKQYGFYGAPLGTTIAMSVAAVYYLWIFHRFMERPLLPFLRTILLKPALSAFASGLAVLAATSTLMHYVSGSRIRALLVFVAGGIIFVSFYVFLILKSRHLDSRDIKIIRDSLPFFRS